MVKKKNLHILIVDDEIDYASSLMLILNQEGYTARGVHRSSEVLDLLSHERIDVLISDIRMPELGGMDLLEKVSSMYPSIAIIMITGFPTVENAVRAIKLGAENFLTKPIPPEALISEIETIRLKLNHLNQSRRHGKSSIETSLVTRDPEFLGLIAQLKAIIDSGAPVLITGESGTGKELVAEYLHYNSSRSTGPYVRINSAAIPEGLLESELFGAEKGAFTDSLRTRIGKFEEADGGTIFLDEIGDMSLSAQARILRVVQEQRITRIGGTGSIPINIRIVAASNKNLLDLIKQNMFREDLYYRLSVITFLIPPLRNRQGDIPVLMDYFLKKYNAIYEKNIRGFSDEVSDIFSEHHWPGNVRELKNYVERAVLFCFDQIIEMKHIPNHFHSLQMTSNSHGNDLDSINRKQILEALEKTGGVRNRAADLLNIDRRTLYNRMKRLGIT